jgi:hypothetical protein
MGEVRQEWVRHLGESEFRVYVRFIVVFHGGRFL